MIYLLTNVFLYDIMQLISSDKYKKMYIKNNF